MTERDQEEKGSSHRGRGEIEVTDPNNIVGNNIRRERRSLGMTVNGLAQAAGIHGSFVSRVERGVINKPNVLHLMRIAGVFNTTVGVLTESDIQTDQLIPLVQQTNRRTFLLEILDRVESVESQLTMIRRAVITELGKLP